MNNHAVFKTSYGKNALLLTLLLLLIGIGSFLWIWLFPADSTNDSLIADIYQNGELLQSIPLSTVTKPFTLTISNEGNAVNEIEVRPGSIGIVSANCPDKLCVHQGFISGSLLPITCLPNRLVIQIREEKSTNRITVDTITY